MTIRTLAEAAVAALALAAPSAGQGDGEWRHWRGPLATGVAPAGDPPIEWSENENVRWKAAVPGRGHATPIVVADRVFVATAIGYGERVDPVPDDMPGAHDNAPVTQRQEYALLAFAREDGEQLWHRALRKQLPHAGGHSSGTLASASPVTDGERVFAYFGSQGLYCVDFDGEVVWEQDFGDMAVKHGHGEGSSPVLHGETIVVNWDHEGQSFLVALDTRDGAERWRVRRNEVTSWSSPIVVEHDGVPQVIVNGTKRVRGYDLETGAVIWECRGLSNNIVASPVAGDGIVVVGSSYEKQAMLAIRLDDAKGDITRTENVVWKRRRRTPYVPSPLLYGKWVYFLNHYQGVLSRVELATGAEPHGPFRLGGLFDIYASPVGVADRVYFTDRSGGTAVLSHTDGVPELLAFNQLEDSFSASLAIAGDELYLRGESTLYCIGK